MCWQSIHILFCHSGKLYVPFKKKERKEQNNLEISRKMVSVNYLASCLCVNYESCILELFQLTGGECAQFANTPSHNLALISHTQNKKWNKCIPISKCQITTDVKKTIGSISANTLSLVSFCARSSDGVHHQHINIKQLHWFSETFRAF